MRETATRDTPLPPSMEKAYHTKCIELKRRLREIEEANEAATLRKIRLERGIAKLRITRAFLLEQVAKVQLNPDGVETDRSESPPPTPQGPPARVKRNRRSSPGLAEGHRSSIHMEAPLPREIPQQVYPAVGDPYSAPHPVPVQIAPALHHRASINHPIVAPPPLQALAAAHVQPHPSPLAGRPAHPGMPAMPMMRSPIDPNEEARARMLQQTREQLPLIHSLPNGTSVMLIGPNEPKPAPWTIRDLGPQHQIHPQFELWPPERQEHYLFDEHMPYLPYDIYGKAVCVNWDKTANHYIHVFPGDAGYIDPVKGNIRTDTPDRKRRIVLDLINKQRMQFHEAQAQQREHRRRESREVRASDEQPRPSTGERRESGRERKDRESRGAVVAAPADDTEIREVAAPPPATAVAGRSSVDGAADERGHRHRESGRESVASATAVSPSGGSPPVGAGGFTAANAPGGPAGR